MIPIRLNFADGTQEQVMALAVPREHETVITSARPGMFFISSVSHTFGTGRKPGIIDVALCQIAEVPV